MRSRTSRRKAPRPKACRRAGRSRTTSIRRVRSARVRSAVHLAAAHTRDQLDRGCAARSSARCSRTRRGQDLSGSRRSSPRHRVRGRTARRSSYAAVIPGPCRHVRAERTTTEAIDPHARGSQRSRPRRGTDERWDLEQTNYTGAVHRRQRDDGGPSESPSRTSRATSRSRRRRARQAVEQGRAVHERHGHSLNVMERGMRRTRAPRRSRRTGATAASTKRRWRPARSDLVGATAGRSDADGRIQRIHRTTWITIDGIGERQRSRGQRWYLMSTLSAPRPPPAGGSSTDMPIGPRAGGTLTRCSRARSGLSEARRSRMMGRMQPHPSVPDPKREKLRRKLQLVVSLVDELG